jgi:O-antigen/teichoic acid export membrane protein
MKLASTVLRNSAAGVAAQLAIKVLSFGFTVLIVRNLGAEQYGQYTAVLAFGAIFVFLADLGLGVYVVREVSRFRAAVDGAGKIAAIFGDSLALRAALSCGAAVLLMGTAVVTGRPPEMLVALAIGAVGLIVFSVQGASESVLAGFERLDVAALAKVVNQVVFVVLGALVLYVGAGYQGLAAASLVGAIVMTTICYRKVRGLGVEVGKPAPRAWPRLLVASAPFAVIAGTLGLSYKFDSVLLNLTRGDAETGFYNAAYSLVFAAVFLSNAVNTALYPSLTRHAASDPASLPTVYARALRYLLALAIPIAAGGWALSDRLVALLYGDSYGPAGPALAILIWVLPLMFASELLGYIVVIRGDERRVAKAVLISTGINVACNLALVPWLGLTGAAVMTVVTEAILVAQYVWSLRPVLAEIDWSITLGRTVLAALVMTALALLLRDLPVAVTVAACGAVYGMSLLVLGVIGRGELALLSTLRRGSRQYESSPAAADAHPSLAHNRGTA